MCVVSAGITVLGWHVIVVLFSYLYCPGLNAIFRFCVDLFNIHVVHETGEVVVDHALPRFLLRPLSSTREPKMAFIFLTFFSASGCMLLFYRVTVNLSLRHKLSQNSHRYGQNMCLYAANQGILRAKGQRKEPTQTQRRCL